MFFKLSVNPNYNAYGKAYRSNCGDTRDKAGILLADDLNNQKTIYEIEKEKEKSGKSHK